MMAVRWRLPGGGLLSSQIAQDVMAADRTPDDMLLTSVWAFCIHEGHPMAGRPGVPRFHQPERVARTLPGGREPALLRQRQNSGAAGPWTIDDQQLRVGSSQRRLQQRGCADSSGRQCDRRTLPASLPCINQKSEKIAPVSNEGESRVRW